MVKIVRGHSAYAVVFAKSRKRETQMRETKGQFTFACYRLLRRVPRGKITTYQEIAHALGSKAYRAVGQAMAKNPHAPKVPCHRVIRSDGRLGGYAGGVNKKTALLKKEGLTIKKCCVVNFKKRLYKFRVY